MGSTPLRRHGLGVLAFLALAPPLTAQATFRVNTGDDRGGDSYRQDQICDTRNNPTTSPPTPPSGVCTLRAAIEQANFSPGRNTILVATSTLTVTTIPLPAATQPVALVPAGTSRVILDGSQVGTVGDGLSLRGGSSEVRRFVIRRFQGDGIHVSGGGSNVLRDLDVRDNQGDGIHVQNSADNRIGAPGRGNMIIGNFRAGIRIVGPASTDNRIEGNFIGTDRSGTTASGNQDGVALVNAPRNVIGGPTPAQRNLISGNRGNGIWITGAPSRLNEIRGNYVGVGADGRRRLANTGDGVHISDGALNMIGGAAAGDRNVISGNRGDGIQIQRAAADSNAVRGNHIGVDASGSVAVPNDVSGIFVTGAGWTFIGGAARGERNVISGNGRFGITIQAPGSGHTRIENNLIGLAANGVDALGNGDDGVFLTSTPENVIGGPNDPATGVRRGNVIAGNAGDGIQIDGSASRGNVIQGNYIGTTEIGDRARPNAGIGVFLSRAPGNTIGGPRPTGPGPSPHNLVSGNGDDGIQVARREAAGNRILGNVIGLDATELTDLGNGGVGVFLSGAPGNRVGGENRPGAGQILGNVISGNESDGVQILGSEARDNEVAGNLIGLDRTGTSVPQGTPAPPAGQRVGVFISRAPQNTVGGAAPGLRNVISGNAGRGVVISGSDASGNTVVGNYIGTDSTGTRAVGNAEAGILISHADSNTVGGPTPRPGQGPGNVISGNWTSRPASPPYSDPVAGAIHVQGDTARDNRILGNLIGLQRDNAAALPNRSAGILFAGGAHHNDVGGTGAGEANHVAHNHRGGVVVESGIGNRIASNSIHENAVAGAAGVVPRPLGIDLARDGLTANDDRDADGGANDRQNVPLLLADRGGAPHVDVRLEGTPAMLFDVEVFGSRAAHASGFGEGETLLGRGQATTDARGRAEIRIAAPHVAGQLLTATATDTIGSTSEFSCVAGSVDLDVDSDNTSRLAALPGLPTTANYGPSRDPAEDGIEQDTSRAGRYLLVNDGDDDGNGAPDWGDGQGAAANARERDFVRMVLEIPAPTDLAAARIRFVYPRSDPSAAGAGGPAPGTLRIWTRPGDRARSPLTLPGGHFVDTTAAYTPAQLGFGGGREAVLWVEGVRPSTARGGEAIEVRMDPDGPGAATAGFDCADVVRVTPVSLHPVARVGAPPVANRPIPLPEAYTVSNHVTSATLPAAAAFGADNADPENFRLQVVDPMADPARDSVRIEVRRGGARVRGPFTHPLSSRGADTLRTAYLRAVSDAVDDAFANGGNPFNQTVRVALGDTVRTTYVPAGGGVAGLYKDRMVARPAAEDANAPANERPHDIRRLRVHIVVFRNRAGTGPVDTRASIQRDTAVMRERLAQAGIELDVRGIDMGPVGDSGVALPPAVGGVDWADGVDAPTAVVGAALHAEETAIFGHKDGDANSVDIFITPPFSAATAAIVGLRARAYPALLASPDPIYRNNVIATASRQIFSLSHELMHILLNAAHRGGESPTSLFRGGTSLVNAVGATKRIGPRPATAVAGVPGHADVTTIRSVAENIP